MSATGKTINQYEIGERLGGGGMGVVYRARDNRLERDVALKFLPPHLSLDEQVKERFVHEARSASALDHPHICTIHDVDETEDGQLFIAMALYEGQSLRERLEAGPLATDEALTFATQLADALVAAHAAGLVHRDVKPANVMITSDGLAKLLDFGLVKDAGMDLTEPGSSMGTIAYMSPEQARGQVVDGRSDVWSLAVVLHEMLAGERPFQGKAEVLVRAILEDEPAPLPAGIPRELAALVARGLAKDRGKRFASMQEFLDELRALQSQRMLSAAGTPPRSRRSALLATVVVVAAASVAGIWFKRSSRETWARAEALPEIERLIENVRYDRPAKEAWTAFTLMQEVAEVLGDDDPQVVELWPRITCELDLRSEPTGALVRARGYGDDDGAWITLGRTPLEKLRVPWGISTVKVEAQGAGSVRDILWGMTYFGSERRYIIDAANEVPEGMTRVAVESIPLQLPGLDHLEKEPLVDFFIDRFEVTNAEFKRFIEAGGYEKAEYWKITFEKDGETLSLDQARKFFVDMTGRTGPATWEVGDYPEGKADHPVGGLSWYEAAAYAEFVGKELPTIFHWNMVAFTFGSFAIIPRSNFGDETVPVGTGGENRYGTHDLAGNVREWCWSETSRSGKRFTLGGGYDDMPYAFNDAFAASPFDRSPTNGVRCISVPGTEPNRERLMRTIETPFRDFSNEQPVSDETFEVFLRQFDYDKAPLNAKIDDEQVEDDGRRLRVSFDAAYGSERMSALLFLPSDAQPPYQTVVVFPGSNAIHSASSESYTTRFPYFRGLLKSGRAIALPIYKGTYERKDELDSDYPDESNFYKDHVIMWAKDLSRTIDYLESRGDIDTDKLAYFGLSWGGAMGAIMPAVEKRLSCNVLYVAGLLFQRALPEVDQINYVTRVTQPTVMLNGEFDFFFPVETSQKPMYELLGTPDQDKAYMVYPGAHSVPRTELMKQVLAWLDRYLGQVN